MEAYPLQWPDFMPKPKRRIKSRFNTTFAKSRDSLINELRLFGCKNPIITSNIPMRRDGLPYANFSEPEDPGVAVWFVRKGQQQCIPCGEFIKTKDNLHAIFLTISALRGMERWKTGGILDRAMSGFFVQLPAPKKYFSEFKHKYEAKQKYLKLCKDFHPDYGGDHNQFIAMKSEYDNLS